MKGQTFLMRSSSSGIKRIVAVPCVSLLLLVVGGCGESDSSDIRTSGFYAQFRITATDNNQTNVWAMFKTGSGIGNDTIILTGGDSLQATALGNTRTLARNSSNAYETDFNIDGGDTEFVISLMRPNDVDAPDSRITLPAAFDILMPNANELFQRGSTITVSWSPSVATEDIRVYFEGECLSRTTGNPIRFSVLYITADVGMFTASVDTIMNVFGDLPFFDTSINCPVTISVQRNSTGSIDPHYGQGGTISAKLIRNRNVIFDP